jgi:dienelactone hydrolase
MPLDRLGIPHWSSNTLAQLHYAINDPFKAAGSVESVMRSINDAGQTAEYHQYPGDGHLPTDLSRPSEFDTTASSYLWAHVIRFLDA